MTRLVLASGSPRRKEILGILGLEFEARSPDLDEIVHPAESPADAVRRLAEEKAASVQIEANDLILAADTVVVLEGEILGKPRDPSDAASMLMRLTGRTHDGRAARRALPEAEGRAPCGGRAGLPRPGRTTFRERRRGQRS